MGWKLTKAPTRKVKIPRWIGYKSGLREPYELGVIISRNFYWMRINSMAAAIAYRAMFATVPLIMLMILLAKLFQGGTILRALIEDDGITGELFIQIA